MNRYYIAAALVAPAAMLVEHLLARRAQIRAYRFEDTVTNVSSFAGELVLTALLKLNVFAAYAWLVDRVALVRLDARSWLVWVLAFLMVDFVYYVGHRVCHRVAAMWALHTVHHQSGEYNLGVGMRGPWLSALQIAPFILPIAVVGFPPSVLFPVYAFSTVYKLAVHTKLIGDLGILGRVLVSPASHRVHHASNPEYHDKNFGGVLVVWDKLFGTHAVEGAPVTFAPGASHAAFDTIDNNVGPWRDIARRAREVGPARALLGRPFAPASSAPALDRVPRGTLRYVSAGSTILASVIALALLSLDGFSLGARLVAAALAFTLLAIAGRIMGGAAGFLGPKRARAVLPTIGG